MGQEQPQGGAAGRGATQVTLEHFSAWELPLLWGQGAACRNQGDEGGCRARLATTCV